MMRLQWDMNANKDRKSDKNKLLWTRKHEHDAASDLQQVTEMKTSIRYMWLQWSLQTTRCDRTELCEIAESDRKEADLSRMVG